MDLMSELNAYRKYMALAATVKTLWPNVFVYM